MNSRKSLTIKQDDQNPVAVEVLATAIADLSLGVKKLLAGPLSRRAIVVLLADHTGQPMMTIRNVLDGIESLDNYLVRKKQSA